MDILKILKEKLEKYGEDEYICTKKELQGNWEKNAFTDQVKPKNTEDLWVRSRLLPLGRIVEEDLKAHTYSIVYEVGKPFGTEAFAVTAADKDTVYIAAFSKDKLFCKGTAKKAAELLISKLNK